MLEAATYHSAAESERYQRFMANLPRLANDAAATEKRARLSADTFDALFSGGWLDLVSPRSSVPSCGQWPTLLETSRIAARACASTGWMIALVGGHGSIVRRLPPEHRQHLYACGPRQLFASASASDGSRFTWTPDGIRVDGRWRFSSGIQDATWLILNAPCQAHPHVNQASRFLLLVPAGELEIVDSWGRCGMAGTGSHDVIGHSLCVPHDQVSPLHELFDQRPVQDMQAYLDHVPLIPYLTTSIIGPLLGCAEGAYDSHVGALISQGRTIDGRTTELLAHSAAELACARLLYLSLISRLHDAGTADLPLDTQQLLVLKRDRSYLAHLCVQSVQRLVRQQGASSLSMANTLQRHWRDIQAMAMHRDVAWTTAMEMCS